jgi:hypothetical protein
MFFYCYSQTVMTVHRIDVTFRLDCKKEPNSMVHLPPPKFFERGGGQRKPFIKGKLSTPKQFVFFFSVYFCFRSTIWGSSWISVNSVPLNLRSSWTVFEFNILIFFCIIIFFFYNHTYIICEHYNVYQNIGLCIYGNSPLIQCTTWSLGQHLHNRRRGFCRRVTELKD